MQYFDSHCHLKPTQKHLDLLLSSMDRSYIEKSFVVGGGLLHQNELALPTELRSKKSNEITCDNQLIAKLCQQHSERLFPFFFANPEVDQVVYPSLASDFYGLKLAPIIHDFSFRDESVCRLLEIACKASHPVYSHCLTRVGVEVKDFVTMAQAHPDMVFILGHAGVGPMDFHAIDLIRDIDNIFYETSGCFFATLAKAIDILPTNRIIFGSEYPLQHPLVELSKYDQIGLTRSQRDMMLYENTNAILDKVLQWKH